MKPPRIFARGGYFWISYYKPGQKNDVRKTTNVALDLPAPGKRPAPDWWKKSKHRKKLQEIYDDVVFERAAVKRGVHSDEPREMVFDLSELLTRFNEVNAIERDRPRSEETLKHRKNAIDFLLRELKGRPWYTLGRDDVLQIRKDAKTRLAPASLRGYFVVLKMLYAYAVREKLLESNPFEGITVTVPTKTPARVTLQDEQSLFTFLYHKNRDLFYQAMIQRLTGLRVVDVTRLEKSWIDRQEWTLHFQPSKGRGREEIMPLSTAAQQLLQMMPARESEMLFPFRDKRTVIRYLRKASEYAGVPQIRSHQLKRSYLQELAKVEPDPRTYELLSHHAPTTNITAVKHYAGADLDLMRTALEKAQQHWIAYLKELPATKSEAGDYRFAN